MTLRTLNYGNYGIFLIMGNAGFCPSAVLLPFFHSLLTKGRSKKARGASFAAHPAAFPETEVPHLGGRSFRDQVALGILRALRRPSKGRVQGFRIMVWGLSLSLSLSLTH